jgi:protein-S-isoprenylcysteine O-methyltransferase Ste14
MNAPLPVDAATAAPLTAANAAAATRPPSAVSAGVGMAGLVGLLIWFGIARWYGMDGPSSALAGLACCGGAMVLWSLLIDKVHRNPSTGIDWDGPPRSLASTEIDWDNPPNFQQSAIATARVKLAGLWATWAIIGFVYGVLRYYWDGGFLWAMQIFAQAMPVIALASIPYVVWLDRRLVEPRDGAWHFGRWLLGGDDADITKIWHHWRAWLVKGFFLAFMLSAVPGNFAGLIQKPWAEVLASPVNMASYGIGFLFFIDVHFATVGYILTMRPLDAHIRTANPYGMAWVAALICYPPFVLMNPGGPLFYQGNTASWDQWLAMYPALLWIWGAALVLLTGIYAWATIAFGPRFSNLTHRGILTHGPYRFTRHPAYLSKNAFWWLSSLVFLPTDGSVVTAVRNVVLLACVSGIYYWRAKTEEKHLLGDPAYRAYYDWSQAHAPVPRFFAWVSGMAKPAIVMEPDPRVGPVV